MKTKKLDILQTIIEIKLENPTMTISQIANKYNMNYDSVKNNLDIIDKFLHFESYSRGFKDGYTKASANLRAAAEINELQYNQEELIKEVLNNEK